ncbi:MAG TPA: TolC family protein [Anaeromyxobacteraceae bacterium]|nr:TolC family protein [Anaeromyxobacteraceae bacterium]
MTAHAITTALLLAQVGQAPGTPPLPPLLLEEALREAGSRNLDLKATRARLEQSKELHWEAWSAYLPKVTASGTFTHNNFQDILLSVPAFFTVRGRSGAPGTAGNPAPSDTNPITGGALPGLPSNDFLFTQNENVLIQKQNQLNAEVDATQALVAPQAWFAIAAARSGERLAEDTTENTRRDILFSVAQAYYSAAGLKQVVAVQQRQLAIARDHERDAKVRYDAGTTPKVTLLRAQIDRARAEQDLKRAQNSYLSSKVALATLLDRKEAGFEVVVPPSPPVPSSEPETLEQGALRDRPDVQAAAEEVTVAERNRAGTAARYLPTLGAFGRYQYSNAAGFTGENSTWAVGLALNWNILDGLLRESDLRQSGAKVREAEAARASTQSKAVADVRQAQLDLDSAVANRAKAREELRLAEENQRLVNVNYKAGAATYIEVADANATLLTAGLTVVSESLNSDLAALRLLRAVGVFNPR